MNLYSEFDPHLSSDIKKLSMGFLSTQPYKGTRDFYPEDMRVRNWMFAKIAQVVRSYGYGEYGGPILEPFELYAAKTGDEIVNQQLYSLVDRGERKVAIRPEMTPTLARMVAAKFFELPRPVRLFCIPNFMRYERPQRGRLREFWQLNVDVLGGLSHLADAEILNIAWDIIDSFGGSQYAVIRVNDRRLMDAFFREKLKLQPDQVPALARLIDAREKMGPEAFEESLSKLSLSDRLTQLNALFNGNLDFKDFSASLKARASVFEECGEGWASLNQLASVLEQSGFKGKAIFDPSVMRGLDYYTGTVFEVFDVSPENHRAMFGGGRYDNLLGLFGKNQLSGMGFGMGDVTLMNFLETHKLLPKLGSDVDVALVVPNESAVVAAGRVTRDLRSQGIRVAAPLTQDGVGAQLKAASKLEARGAIILGEEELKRNEVVLKDMAAGTQENIPLDQLGAAVRRLIAK